MAGCSKIILKLVRVAPLPKLHQKDMNKEKKARSKMPGEWLFVDINHVKSQSFGGLQYWLLAISNVTDCSFSLFQN